MITSYILKMPHPPLNALIVYIILVSLITYFSSFYIVYY